MQKIDIVKDLVLPGFILLFFDFIYISATKNAFELQIAAVQRVSLQLRPLGAIVCYIFLIFGLYYFILREHRSIMEAFLFGLVIYGVYDSTTYAVLKKWDIKLAIMDTLWGGVLMALTTFFTYKYITKR
jgi:uncharacterized membrane protein